MLNLRKIHFKNDFVFKLCLHFENLWIHCNVVFKETCCYNYLQQSIKFSFQQWLNWLKFNKDGLVKSIIGIDVCVCRLLSTKMNNIMTNCHYAGFQLETMDIFGLINWNFEKITNTEKLLDKNGFIYSASIASSLQFLGVRKLIHHLTTYSLIGLAWKPQKSHNFVIKCNVNRLKIDFFFVNG